ncbi:MAG: hypothetical protein K0R15_151 [Clostridiales bacterium]|jgi:hypothetical protein|nr:hypothetical protein [Clostridiales bacterium]
MIVETVQEQTSLLQMAQLFVDYADNIYTGGKISTCEYQELTNTKVDYLDASCCSESK